MNIQHFELFSYVARHGGISEALRNMLYGIRQPATSSQVILMEQDLGVTPFQRRPFQLAPAGEELFAFIMPFSDNVEPMAARLRGGGRYEHLRVGAPEIILRDHSSAPLRSLRRKFPELKVTLRIPAVSMWRLPRVSPVQQGKARQRLGVFLGMMKGGTISVRPQTANDRFHPHGLSRGKHFTRCPAIFFLVLPECGS